MLGVYTKMRSGAKRDFWKSFGWGQSPKATRAGHPYPLIWRAGPAAGRAEWQGKPGGGEESAV